MKHDKKSDIFI